MMSRRRALLINTTKTTEQKPYNIRIIDSLLVHQADTENKFSAWFVGNEFTVDTETGLITVTDGSLFPLRYSNAELLNIHMAGNYCILNSASGNTMYYFSSSCTASYSYDAVSGLYTVTANGQIQVYTPIMTN